jgi:hypothetical protein
MHTRLMPLAADTRQPSIQVVVLMLVLSGLFTGGLPQSDHSDISFDSDRVDISGSEEPDYIRGGASPVSPADPVNKPNADEDAALTTWAPYCADVSTGNLDIACMSMIQGRCEPDEVFVSYYTYSRSNPTLVSTGRHVCAGGESLPVVEAGAATDIIILGAEQFQSLPIPGSTIEMQPDGFSLRNAHTNIYASSATRTLSTTILGQSVAVRATPYEYRWTYGDGSTRATTTPGAPISGEPFESETATSHVYTETGDYPVGLTTVYTGQFSVAGGPWMPVAGLATVPSPTVEVSVWRTKKLLVDSNCLENPSGPACASPFDE